ncbi:MAG: RdgB/HAM1 family non-canonical purine NTP pyrophosphatase [Verrucomicrobiota bacterium]|jgi:XTP/dITP diphosphohydrolase|nr:RdgB/HAM1 family non-canonical purine NTP pyrophosphatase [Verrucomicrobiota bacterium]
MPRLILASRNVHKAKEIATILGNQFTVQTLANFPAAPEVVEDGETFAANAVKKAVEIAAWLNGQALGQARPDLVLADDSGLAVDALGGEPGVRSARYAGDEGNAPDTANNAKLLHKMDGIPERQRGAQFQCVLALIALGQAAQATMFDGICRGTIARAQTGKGGFGYDPLFIPEGHTESFAELGPVVKNEISHRARALAKLAEHFIEG